MFNFWSLFFFTLPTISLIFLTQINNLLLFLLISEFNWINFINCTILLAQYTNDSRFFLLVYFFLFIAAVEIVLYLLYSVLKN